MAHVQAADTAGEIDEGVAVDVSQQGAAAIGNVIASGEATLVRSRSRISRERGPGISVFSSIARVVAIARRA
jgi:hypothetical protein